MNTKCDSQVVTQADSDVQLGSVTVSVTFIMHEQVQTLA